MRAVIVVVLVVAVVASLSWYNGSAASGSLVEFASTAYGCTIDSQISLSIDISNSLPQGSAHDIPEGQQPLALVFRVRNSSYYESEKLSFALRFSEAFVDYLELNSAPGIVVRVDKIPPASEWQSSEVYFIPQFNGEPEAIRRVEELLKSPIMVQAMVSNNVDHLLVMPTVSLEKPAVSHPVAASMDTILGWVGDRVLVCRTNPQGLELEIRGPDGSSEPLGVGVLPKPLATPVWDSERRYLAYATAEHTVVVVDVTRATSKIIFNACDPTWTPLGLQVTYESIGRVIRF